jgi:hypothetical protein
MAKCPIRKVSDVPEPVIHRRFKGQESEEETMKMRRALHASTTAVPGHRRQFEGTFVRYVVDTKKSKNH